MANVYTDAVFHAQLETKLKIVLWVLAWRTNKAGVCWPSYTSIARYAGCGESTAKEAIRKLLDEEIIKIVGKVPIPGTKLCTNKYQLQLDAIKELENSVRLAYRVKSRTSVSPNSVANHSTRCGSYTQLGVSPNPNSVWEPAELGVGANSKPVNKNSSENSSWNPSGRTHNSVLYEDTGETPVPPSYDQQSSVDDDEDFG